MNRFWTCLTLVAVTLFQTFAAQGASINSVILAEINEMPVGGRYSASREATVRLQSAVHFEQGRFFFKASGGGAQLLFRSDLPRFSENH